MAAFLAFAEVARVARARGDQVVTVVLAADILLLGVDDPQHRELAGVPVGPAFLALVELGVCRPGAEVVLVAGRLDPLHEEGAVVVLAVEVDVDPPQGVVQVRVELAGAVVAAGRAHAEGDRAVVLEAVFHDVAVVGRIEAGPQH